MKVSGPRWLQRGWRRALRWARLLAALLLLVLLVSPLRDALFSPVMPGAWRSHTSLRLVQMLMDNQHFPVRSPLLPQAGGPLEGARLQVNLSDVNKFIIKEDPYPEFEQHRRTLRQRIKEGEASGGAGREVREELAMLEGFKPVMNQTERAQLLFTMEVFLQACSKHGLTFFLFEGSLLGAYRHKGLVPWDDDVDIALNASQWQLVHQVLNNIPGFTLYAPSDTQWKFYLSHLQPFYDKPFKWPNLDLFFFTERDDYVWGLTWGVKNHLILHTKYLLPFSQVKWERWTLPAPACVERMLRANYGDGVCVTPMYVHKTNEESFAFQTKSVPCSRLHRHYPFVFRRRRGHSVEETVRVGGRLISNRTVPGPPDLCLE